VLAARDLPRRYHSETRIFALPPDGVPGVVRAASGEPSGLASGAAEVVLNGESLEQLIHDHDLLQKFDLSRPPLMRAVDRARQFGELPDETDRRRALIGYLRKSLTVKVKGPEVILSFDWPEAQTAFEVVRASAQKLFAARRAADLLPLERKVATLEERAAAVQRSLDEDVARVDAAIQAKRRGARHSTAFGLQADGLFRDMPDARLAQLRLDLIARRKVIGEADDTRRRKLAELQATFAEQKATLGPRHTALLDTEEKIRAFQREGAKLDSMKAQEQALFAEYVKLGGKEIELSPDPAPAWPPELREDDAATSADKARVAVDLASLQRVHGELDDAAVSLAAAGAAFASRYAVITPAEIPEKPIFPTPALMLPAGILGGLLLAIFGAVAADLRAGVIRESWQARRKLELPVLAEVPAT
jgi:hypothetical protein